MLQIHEKLARWLGDDDIARDFVSTSCVNKTRRSLCDFINIKQRNKNKERILEANTGCWVCGFFATIEATRWMTVCSITSQSDAGGSWRCCETQGLSISPGQVHTSWTSQSSSSWCLTANSTVYILQETIFSKFPATHDGFGNKFLISKDIFYVNTFQCLVLLLNHAFRAYFIFLSLPHH